MRGNLGSETMQHVIVSAPRGYGKSFMMRHVQIELEAMAGEEKLNLAVVLMPEEMPHVKEPETLIGELTRALTGGAADTAVLSWHEDDGGAWDDAVEALQAAIADRLGVDGLFVAMVENFDLLLRRAFGKEVQAARLRNLLTAAGGRMMLIAASASGAFDRDYDKVLFHAFREVTLEPWSIEDCMNFFDRQRKDAGKAPLTAGARARAQAVVHFIGGTPRLATLLGDALFDDDLLLAADLLQRLIDELTPYYKERVEALPGRSQKLLDALLRGGEPATQSELSARVNARSQAAIAAPFQDLIRERIVVGDKASGSAEILYRVADRVFAHFYRRRVIDHGKQACPLEALVDLLAAFFSADEKRDKAREFARAGHYAEARVMAGLYDRDVGENAAWRKWILRGLAEDYIPKRLAGLASQAGAEFLEAIAEAAMADDAGAAYAAVKSALAGGLAASDQVLLLLARARLDAWAGIYGGLDAAERAESLAKDTEDVVLRIEAALARVWATVEVRQFEAALQMARAIAEQDNASMHPRQHSVARGHAALCLGMLGRHDEALVAAKEAAKLARAADDLHQEATAHLHAVFSLDQLGRHDEAVVAASEAARLARAADAPRVEAWAMLEISKAHAMRGDPVLAIGTWITALSPALTADDEAVWAPNMRSMATRASVELAAGDRSDSLHTALRILATDMSASVQKLVYRDIWVREFVRGILRAVADAAQMSRIGAAIGLHFPVGFGAEIGQLRAAAAYHGSGRNAAVLARVDPDLAQVLKTMYPPAKAAKPKRKRR